MNSRKPFESQPFFGNDCVTKKRSRYNTQKTKTRKVKRKGDSRPPLCYQFSSTKIQFKFIRLFHSVIPKKRVPFGRWREVRTVQLPEETGEPLHLLRLFNINTYIKETELLGTYFVFEKRTLDCNGDWFTFVRSLRQGLRTKSQISPLYYFDVIVLSVL